MTSRFAAASLPVTRPMRRGSWGVAALFGGEELLRGELPLEALECRQVVAEAEAFDREGAEAELAASLEEPGRPYTWTRSPLTRSRRSASNCRAASGRRDRSRRPGLSVKKTDCQVLRRSSVSSPRPRSSAGGEPVRDPAVEPGDGGPCGRRTRLARPSRGGCYALVSGRPSARGRIFTELGTPARVRRGVPRYARRGWRGGSPSSSLGGGGRDLGPAPRFRLEQDLGGRLRFAALRDQLDGSVEVGFALGQTLGERQGIPASIRMCSRQLSTRARSF